MTLRIAEAGGLEPLAVIAARIAFQASSVPDGFTFLGLGSGTRGRADEVGEPLRSGDSRGAHPQPLGSGPSALARLSYTQVSSARWESNPERTRIRRPGLTETTRGRISATSEDARRAVGHLRIERSASSLSESPG
jgi:hypothetical protein